MDSRKLRTFHRVVARHIEALGSREDYKILLEIAATQQEGNRQTLKTLLQSVAIPESTLKRRLSSLVKKRLVMKQMTSDDRRVHCYSLPEKTLKVLAELVRDIRAFRWD